MTVSADGKYRNPTPTVDILIEHDGGLVFIRRNGPPLGWAIPGGFVDEGETVEQAAIREAREETGLDVELVELLGVYSDPRRDPRLHTMSTVFVAAAQGEAIAGDDAGELQVWRLGMEVPALVFDHRVILEDYLRWRQTGKKPRPWEMLERLRA
jgi:8-oxo-dGTP diphosphatase